MVNNPNVFESKMNYSLSDDELSINNNIIDEILIERESITEMDAVIARLIKIKDSPLLDDRVLCKQVLLVFEEEFPHLRKPIAVTTLFIPSVLIWTTGILKEPLCMFGLGICFYTLNNILKRRNVIKNIISLLVGSLLLLIIKNYIFYAFISISLI